MRRKEKEARKKMMQSKKSVANSDVGASFQQNDTVQSPSQAIELKLANEDVFGNSDQQNDVAQEEQPATFLNLNQPQQVSPDRNLNREIPPPFDIGLSPPGGRELEGVSVEQQHGNQQPQERRNENVIGNNENRPAGTSIVDSSDSRRISSFWTACPYCYVMYEYPLEYVDYTLKCQNCKRAFQAVKVAAPPIVDGEEAYFCCWGFMPLGFSVESYERSRNNVLSWSTFSPMFSFPSSGVTEGRNANNHTAKGQGNVSTFGDLHNVGGSERQAGREQSAPRIIYSDDEDDNDDDILFDISEVFSGDA
ncbi:hypothetical protein BC332_18174 [Capsicum chinense]|nr:hypothetical protein BC332_18174 [Capsicum chinense]